MSVSVRTNGPLSCGYCAAVPSEWKWWLGSRDMYLRDRAEELESALASTAHAARSQQAELARQQGSLEQRLGRLETSFDALVELCEIREELDVFADADMARRRTRDLLVALGAFGGTPGAVVAPTEQSLSIGGDVVGYWLPPAADALPSLRDGADVNSHAGVMRARERDPERTNRFLVLSMALLGHGGRIGRLVGPLLAPYAAAPADPIDAVQRALWVAAAQGALGDEGRSAVEQWLRSAVAAVVGSGAVLSTQGWEDGGAALTSWRPATTTGLQRTAHEAITRRLRLAHSLAGIADRSARSDTAPAAAADDSWRPVFQAAMVEMVDEGSEVERPLLRRAAELRQSVAPHLQTSATATTTTDRGALADTKASAGTIDSLVRGDALAAAEGSPLCDMAWRAGAPLIGKVVGQIETAARDAAVEPSATMSIGGFKVTIDGSEITSDVTAAIEADALVRYPLPSGLLKGLRDDENEDRRQAERERLTQQFEEQRAHIAGLRAQLAGLDATIGDAMARLRASGITPK